MSCLDCTEMDLSLKLPYKGQSRLIALGLYNAAWVSCENVAWNEGQWKGAELAKQVWLKLCNQGRDGNYGKIPHRYLRINFFCCIFRLPSEPMGQLEKYTAMTLHYGNLCSISGICGECRRYNSWLQFLALLYFFSQYLWYTLAFSDKMWNGSQALHEIYLIRYINDIYIWYDIYLKHIDQHFPEKQTLTLIFFCPKHLRRVIFAWTSSV